jgi:diguanylate cyclase (GGDEF)-like protein/PAS domain S-box-containing protein
MDRTKTRLIRPNVAPASDEGADRARLTLDAIADGVMSTDTDGLVSYCNPVAASLTGWDHDEVRGRRFIDVFRLIDATTRIPLPDPLARPMHENGAVWLRPDCVLVHRDGSETAVEDSAAPIHDPAGKIIGAVIVFRDASATRASALKMAHLAQHDVLTDLPNRFLLADRLGQAIERAERDRRILALLFLDLDHFKTINDSLGHAVGDGLLRSLARRLVASVRSTDTVSRQGGDEFVILLSDIARVEDVVVAAEKVMAAIALPHHVEGHELHVTASMGVVVYPACGTDTATLLKNGDAAMYHAKENGRNNVQVFTADMHVRAVERQQIESEMRRALKLDQFVLHYQPIVELEHFRLVGVEALVRWQHPTRGLLHPLSFMPVAEQCGFVSLLGRWVVREACRQARAWCDAGFPPLRLAVNTSALELRTHGFVKSLQDCLGETGLVPHTLEIEITETVLLQDSHATAQVLASIAGMGVNLALDDFGTGYSSLSHLKRYPIDTLKIDRSFIGGLATDASDAGIVSALIGLGRSLGLRVVAEGVETVQQAALLRAEGCEQAQGYFFGHPVDARALGEILAKQAARPDVPEGVRRGAGKTPRDPIRPPAS